MEQKRVTEEVAKALIEAGYPIVESIMYHSYFGKINFDNRPTWLDAWLWLWRENIARIVICCDTCYIWYNENDYETMSSRTRDPEEAIEAAIKYIVDNGLLK